MKPLVGPGWLEERLGDVVVADVRWRLGDSQGGRRAFEASRIPGAVHLDMDVDLSAPPSAELGRHPLPPVDRLVETLAAVGIGAGCRVVAYDDAGGACAARLWWLLRWLGHREVAVLDAGFPRWLGEGRAIEIGPPPAPRPAPERLQAQVNSGLVAGVEDVALGGAILLDARAAERYRGEVEPIDARPGHIPGACSLPHASLLGEGDPRGMLRAQELRARFAAAGVTDEASVICYCGSGVTACLLLLAMEIAELPAGRLYPGSYSQWSADPARSVISS